MIRLRVRHAHIHPHTHTHTHTHTHIHTHTRLLERIRRYFHFQPRYSSTFTSTSSTSTSTSTSTRSRHISTRPFHSASHRHPHPHPHPHPHHVTITSSIHPVRNLTSSSSSSASATISASSSSASKPTSTTTSDTSPPSHSHSQSQSHSHSQSQSQSHPRRSQLRRVLRLFAWMIGLGVTAPFIALYIDSLLVPVPVVPVPGADTSVPSASSQTLTRPGSTSPPLTTPSTFSIIASRIINDILTAPTSIPNALHDLKRQYLAVKCLALTIADYKFRLRGISRDDPTYRETLTKIHTRVAKRMLHVAQHNQGVFIKLGQYLSSLKPAVPVEYADVLSVLWDRAVEPQPLSAIEESLRQHLHINSIADSFSYFDPTPIGIASLAQVHQAVTIDGQKVAVKVQHASVDRLTQSDLRTFVFLSRVIAWAFPDYGFEWIVPEFTDILHRELNFEEEARNSERCARNFRHQPQLYIPKVRWDLTSRRVLTMEYMEGCKITDRECIAATQIQSRDAAKLVCQLFSEQIFVYGFVHCDPHPGNLFVRPLPSSLHSRLRVRDRIRYWWSNTGKWWMPWNWFTTPTQRIVPQIVLLDHGLYRELDEAFRVHWCGMWHSMVLKDAQSLKHHCERLGVGRYWHIFPLLFTQSSMTSKVGLGKQISEDEKKKVIQEFQKVTMAEINQFLQDLPRDMLLCMRSLNLVRALNYELGGTTSDRLHVYALSVARGIRRHERHAQLSWPARVLMDVRASLRVMRMRITLAILDWWLWWHSAEREVAPEISAAADAPSLAAVSEGAVPVPAAHVGGVDASDADENAMIIVPAELHHAIQSQTGIEMKL